MPDQACANDLKLHDILQKLDSITPLECRLVAKCIPSLPILLMKRYGGHYKVNGPCVNVPTQLDQVLKILPQIPSELQLHPLKLKCQLEYKSHYMYHVIQKDRVIGAITWLKQHNPHYADIIPAVLLIVSRLHLYMKMQYIKKEVNWQLQTLEHRLMILI